MSRSIRRILPPMILLVAGICALVYGAGFRRLVVLQDEEVEKETTILESPPKELLRPRHPGPDGPGFDLPPPPPRPRKIKVKELVTRESLEPEGRVIREVTVGGIERNADGRLQLTYGPGKAGPALCPT